MLLATLKSVQNSDSGILLLEMYPRKEEKDSYHSCVYTRIKLEPAHTGGRGEWVNKSHKKTRSETPPVI